MVRTRPSMEITREYLRAHLHEVFVFGDNQARYGKRGAAALRDEPNTYGFITKKFASSIDSAFFRPEEYAVVYNLELAKLKWEIEMHPGTDYLISKLGAGLANRFHIFEKVIEPNIKAALGDFPNVVFLW